jgi:8-oxo-dGTP pyrophosphatase MutT (NUDIX family)
MNTSTAPARWQKLGQSELARTRIFDLHSVRYRHPARRTERDFVVLHPPDWVNVVALTPDGQLVLVRQFRFGLDDFSLEIPGGVMDAGETPLATGERELREETGFRGRAARLLGTVAPNPAFQRNRCHIVLVEEAVATEALAWDADEEIEVSVRPADEVLALARAGGITHSLVLNALFLFEPWWREKQAGVKGQAVQPRRGRS